MPLWVSRGLAGVLSNTLVRKDEVLVGAPIPWRNSRANLSYNHAVQSYC